MRDKMTGHTYRVDGFIPKDRAGTDRDVVIEYLGCAYHGIVPIIFLHCNSVVKVTIVFIKMAMKSA